MSNNYLLVDPLTGECFEPKRSNQVFACEENRIIYNNSKAKKLRNELNKINKVLLKNFKILDEITDELPEVKVPKIKLLKKGFDFRFITHLSNIGGLRLPTIYCFTLQSLENDYYNITKLDL